MITKKHIAERTVLLLPFGLYARLNRAGILTSQFVMDRIEEQQSVCHERFGENLVGKNLKIEYAKRPLRNADLFQTFVEEMDRNDRAFEAWSGLRASEPISPSFVLEEMKWGHVHRLKVYSREYARTVAGGHKRSKPANDPQVQILAATSDAYSDQAIHDVGQMGWLMTNPVFLEEYKAVLDNNPSQFWRLLTRPSPSMYRSHNRDLSTEGPNTTQTPVSPTFGINVVDEAGNRVKDLSPEVEKQFRKQAEEEKQDRLRKVYEQREGNTGEDNEFLNRWGLNTLHAPGVFEVMPVVTDTSRFSGIPGKTVIPHATGDLVNLTGMAPTMRDLYLAQTRNDPREHRLRSWYELTGAGNTNRERSAIRYARMYLLQHFTRILYGRFENEPLPESKIRQIIGKYVSEHWLLLGEMKTHTIARCYHAIDSQLGPGWEKDLAPYGQW